MEKIGIVLNFSGALLLWLDTWLLSKVISPSQIRLGDPTGIRTILSWICSRLGVTLLAGGFLLQWIYYTP